MSASSASWPWKASRSIRVFKRVKVGPHLQVYAALLDNNYRFVPARLEPEDLPRIHGTDERIAVDNYREIIRFYVQFLRNTATAWK